MNRVNISDRQFEYMMNSNQLNVGVPETISSNIGYHHTGKLAEPSMLTNFRERPQTDSGVFDAYRKTEDVINPTDVDVFDFSGFKRSNPFMSTTNTDAIGTLNRTKEKISLSERNFMNHMSPSGYLQTHNVMNIENAYGTYNVRERRSEKEPKNLLGYNDGVFPNLSGNTNTLFVPVGGQNMRDNIYISSDVGDRPLWESTRD